MAGKITSHRDLDVYRKAFAAACGYLDRGIAAELCQAYDEILGALVGMITHPETWVLHYRGK